MPLKTGVPFTFGAIRSTSNMRLENHNGTSELHAQFEPLAYWPDNSIKSVLVSTVNDLTPGQQNYQLVYGSDVTAHNFTDQIKITDNANDIAIDTGKLSLIISKDQGTVSGLWRDKNSNQTYETNEQIISGSEFFAFNAKDRKEYLASHATDVAVTIEEQGSVRSVITASGTLKNSEGTELVKFKTRYYAYLNSDILDIEHSIIDERVENIAHHDYGRDDLALSLSSYGLRLNLTNVSSTYRFGGDSDTVIQGAISGEHYLYQGGEFLYNNDLQYQGHNFSYSGVASGEKATGWMSLDGDNHLNLSVRDFWQNYPNEFHIQNNTLIIALHPERASGATPETAPPVNDIAIADTYRRAKTFYFLGEGGAKTYQLRFQFPQNKTSDADVIALNNYYQTKDLTFRADQNTYLNSGVFGEINAAGDQDANIGFDAWLKHSVYNRSMQENLIKQFGWRDYGDRMRPGWSAVKNGIRIPTFYNDTHVGANQYFKHYLRTGDAEWYALAEKSTRHFMDIDVSHGPRYGYFNTGGKNQPAGEIHAIAHEMTDHETRNVHGGHAHLSGLTDYYLLTGDKRAYDVFQIITGWWKFMNDYRYNRPSNIDGPNREYREAERDYAWPLYVMNEYVRITGDADYHKNVAGKLVDYAIQWWKTPYEHVGWDPVANQKAIVGTNNASQGTGYWTMTKMDNHGNATIEGKWPNGTNPWMAGWFISNIIAFYETDKQFAAANKASGIKHAEIKDMLLQCLNYIVKYGYGPNYDDPSKKHFYYSEVVRTYSGGDESLIYPLLYLNNLFEQEQSQGNLINPQWYDTQPQWRGIANSVHQSLQAKVKGGNTISTGFYGYELIFPMDSFNLMEEKFSTP